MSAPTSSPSFSTLICSILFIRSPKQKGAVPERRAQAPSLFCARVLHGPALVAASVQAACQRMTRGRSVRLDVELAPDCRERVHARAAQFPGSGSFALPLYAAGVRGRGPLR